MPPSNDGIVFLARPNLGHDDAKSLNDVAGCITSLGFAHSWCQSRPRNGTMVIRTKHSRCVGWQTHQRLHETGDHGRKNQRYERYASITAFPCEAKEQLTYWLLWFRLIWMLFGDAR
jgi:hypothetical protein